MELFTGDHRQLSKPDRFPHHIAPFPESAHPTAEIQFSEPSNLPPQKLRPIRCNDNSPPENGGFAGNLAKGDMGFLEVGLLGNQQGGITDPVQSGSGMEDWNRKQAEEHVLDDGSCSDDGGDSSADIKESVDRKRKRSRKRKSRKKLELFVENMVMKVMEKHEYTHKQLLDVIEKRERERIIREEAWKQQEMERMKRDEEVRAQETSRNLSLISLIENTLGYEVEVPPSF